ncbi:hypothetical protein R8Z50_23005 [Longispora sp. K20-0274]|uniref:hypothetical protein n=1 Tax=Longispora sp. K20-0274 TaxID=3088255 RepID=UPI003999B5D1
MTEQPTAPTPTAVAAWLVLDTMPVENVPWWAAAWLADGYDGQALRELAGLNGRDPHAVRDLLPAALAEIGVALPATDLAAAIDAFRHLAELCLAGQVGERWIAQKVEEIVIRADDSSSVIDLPLGQLYGVDDAWQGGWGPTVEELTAAVRAACAEQISFDTSTRLPLPTSDEKGPKRSS